jgi:hypothetical protein
VSSSGEKGASHFLGTGTVDPEVVTESASRSMAGSSGYPVQYRARSNGVRCIQGDVLPTDGSGSGAVGSVGAAQCCRRSDGRPVAKFRILASFPPPDGTTAASADSTVYGARIKDAFCRNRSTAGLARRRAGGEQLRNFRGISPVNSVVIVSAGDAKLLT